MNRQDRQSGDTIGTLFISHAAIRDERTSSYIIPIEFPATVIPELVQKLRKSVKIKKLTLTVELNGLLISIKI